MPSTRATFTHYAEFWPYYLRQHAKPGTRNLHIIGTYCVIGTAVIAIATGAWWLILTLPVIGYGFAWTGHVAIEGNKPATFGHPVWSLYSDFRMVFLWSCGRLQPHLDAANSHPRRPT